MFVTKKTYREAIMQERRYKESWVQLNQKKHEELLVLKGYIEEVTGGYWRTYEDLVRDIQERKDASDRRENINALNFKETSSK